MSVVWLSIVRGGVSVVFIVLLVGCFWLGVDGVALRLCRGFKVQGTLLVPVKINGMIGFFWRSLKMRCNAQCILL